MKSPNVLTSDSFTTPLLQVANQILEINQQVRRHHARRSLYNSFFLVSNEGARCSLRSSSHNVVKSATHCATESRRRAAPISFTRQRAARIVRIEQTKFVVLFQSMIVRRTRRRANYACEKRKPVASYYYLRMKKNNNAPSLAGPVLVEHLAARLVDALVHVRAKVVSLRLQQQQQQQQQHSQTRRHCQTSRHQRCAIALAHTCSRLCGSCARV